MSNLKHEKKGFTIIEVLISLSILVIILGSVYATFFTVDRALNRFNNVSLKYQEARTALDIIRREIEGSVFESINNQEEMGKKESLTPFSFIDKDIFGKTASELEMTVFSFRGIGLKIISYSVENAGDTLRLIKKESPLLHKSEGYFLDIMDGIESFTVEALYKEKWVKVLNSDETNELPEIVRITIEFNDNGRPVKLREYATPMINEKYKR